MMNDIEKNVFLDVNSDYLSRDFAPLVIPSCILSGKQKFDFNFVSKQLGFSPTSTWIQQHERLLSRKDLIQASWTYSLPPISDLFMESILEKMLDLFLPRKTIIDEMIQENIFTNVSFFFQLYITNSHGLFLMSHEILNAMLELHADFQVEMYPIHDFESLNKTWRRTSYQCHPNLDGYYQWNVLRV